MEGTRPRPDCPLVVAYGLGVNSTAMLVEFARRGIRPDLILFADTGGEKPETSPTSGDPALLADHGFSDRPVRPSCVPDRLSHLRGHQVP